MFHKFVHSLPNLLHVLNRQIINVMLGECVILKLKFLFSPLSEKFV